MIITITDSHSAHKSRVVFEPANDGMVIMDETLTDRDNKTRSATTKVISYHLMGAIIRLAYNKGTATVVYS